MLLIKNVKVPLEADFCDIKTLLSKLLKTDIKDITYACLYKKSIDARKKDDIKFTCSFLIDTKNENSIIKKAGKSNVSPYVSSNYKYKTAQSDTRPIIVGFGPAGMFCALALAKAGLKPIVIERGKKVTDRIDDVNNFFESGNLNTESNIQFGEGGAGTFSDGKLNTGINDFRIREVLNVFASHGAPENILYDAKPHIGTDILVNVVKSIREEIISLGGKILFEHKFIDFSLYDNQINEISVSTPDGIKSFNCKTLIIAIGHSARDTFELLKEKEIKMTPKAFAVGVRIEHKQKDINLAQYGKFYEHKALGAADYKLSTHLENNRGVFTFCMCPGGEVVNASSEKNGVVINGMSNSKRNGENANSAILVGVDVKDYYKTDVLDGMYFQREIEQKAFTLGRGLPIVQTFGDFKKSVSSQKQKNIKSTLKSGYTLEDINKIFPKYISESIKAGITDFGKKIKGFDNEYAILTAPETRSSSPIRILRDESGMSSISGILPCGEGAGYAGGITSAAVDGLKTAEHIIENLSKQKANL